jgi:integrase
MQYADEQSVKLRRGHDDLRAGITPLSMVFSAYRRHRTPKKRSAGERAEDHRRIEMWTRFLGAEADPHSVALRDWEAFIHQRASGELDARGRRVSKARPVGPRTVEKDCNWLQWVFNWAVNWRLPNSRYLMRENPIRGFETPHERNPRRPVVSQARFEAVRAKAEMVGTEIRSGTERIRRRSYLPELLDLAYYTGRRISAICALRYEDLRPQAPRPEDVPEDQPWRGVIRWPAETDKQGKAWVIPMSAPVRDAVDRIMRDRPGIGSAPVFPGPGDQRKPMTRHLADKWLRRAERLAGVAPQPGTLWHGYRRAFATRCKDLPAQDVARAGGWKSVRMVEEIYTQADEVTTLMVVEHAAGQRKVGS